jgi:hypothetical protein
MPGRAGPKQFLHIDAKMHASSTEGSFGNPGFRQHLDLTLSQQSGDQLE